MIIITGGSGFLGHYLYEYLLDRHPLILDIVPPQLKREWQYLDIKNPQDVMETVEDADYVYHLAASADFRLATLNTKHIVDTNLLGSVNVFKACLKHNVPVIYTSTQAIHDRPLTEYSLSKFQAEEYGQILIKKGLDLKIARLGYTYTPMLREGWVMSDLVLKVSMQKEVFLKNSKSYESFTHIRDTFDGLELIKKKGQPGVPYEISRDPITITHLAYAIKHLLNSKARIVGDGVGAMPTYLRNDFVDIRTLGWKSKISVREGLKEAINNPRWTQMKITDEDLERWS